jgi:hypothetical protein
VASTADKTNEEFISVRFGYKGNNSLVIATSEKLEPFNKVAGL